MTTQTLIPETRTMPSLPQGNYLSVTSYRRDGSGVATPVWFVAEGSRLLVQTEGDSYKVKRIRRDPEVTVAECNARGRIRSRPIPARAEILPASETKRVEGLIAGKYRVAMIFFRPMRAVQSALHLGRRRGETVILAITPTPEEAE